MTTIVSVGQPSVPVETDAPESSFGLLADQRRRTVLQHLAENGGSSSLTELAEEIAFRETSAKRSAISDHATVRSADVRSIKISLHHVHIPRLADAGAVEFDSPTDRISLRETGRRLLSRLDAICGSPRDTYDIF